MKGITGNPALDAYQRFAVKPVSPAGPAQGVGGPMAAPRPTEAAKVNISSEARDLASNQAPADTAKLDALRAAIAEGSFKVNPTLVAERMLDGLGI